MKIVEVLKECTAPVSITEIAEVAHISISDLRDQVGMALGCGLIRRVDGRTNYGAYYWLPIYPPPGGMPSLPYEASYPAEAAQLARIFRNQGIPVLVEGCHLTPVVDPLCHALPAWPIKDGTRLSDPQRSTAFASRRVSRAR